MTEQNNDATEAEQNKDVAESLEDLYYVFAKKVLTYIETWAEATGIPQKTLLRTHFSDITSTSNHEYESKNDYYWLHIQHFQERIWTSVEISKCVRVHWEQGILSFPRYLQDQSSIPPTLEQVETMLFQELLFPLIDALDEHDTFQLTHEQIIESYYQYKNEWISPDISYTITIPLLNFTSDLDREEPISTNLKIAPLTAEEKSLIWDHDLRMNPKAMKNIIEFSPFSRTKFELTGTRIQKRDKSFGLNYQSINDELTSVLTALRLSNRGQVGAPAIFERCQRRSIWFPSTTISGTSDYDVNQYGTEYSLNEAALSTIKSLFETLQFIKTQKKPSGLEVALRRFNQAYGRDNQEDKIIDLTVALDSCLNAGMRDELRFRFALRGAALLAGKNKTRETFTLLLAMYDARSAIVHDGKLLTELTKITEKVPPRRQSEEFHQCCEDIVRDILYRYVTQLKAGQSLIDFNLELENHIVDNLVPLVEIQKT